jgi:hypothetical protein
MSQTEIYNISHLPNPQELKCLGGLSGNFIYGSTMEQDRVAPLFLAWQFAELPSSWGDVDYAVCDLCS